MTSWINQSSACSEAYGTDIGVGITGSLGRKDPNNPDSEVRKVFYSINIDGKTTFAELTKAVKHREKPRKTVVLFVL